MDAFSTFAGLIDKYETCFLLETLADNPLGGARRHYIGVAPEAVITDPLALPAALHIDTSLPQGYYGGLVGFMSHEAAACFEPALDFSYERHFPDCQYGRYTDGLIFENDGPGHYITTAGNRAGLYMPSETPVHALSIYSAASMLDERQYTDIIETAKTDIMQGRVFQVVLANTFNYGYDGSLLALYARLRDINPSSYMFFMKFGDIVSMGASPELLSYTGRDSRTSIEALAGTIRRGSDEDEDQQLAEQLRHDDKELAEHNMLVDLVRNDIGRVSSFGSVRIDKLRYIKRLSHVQHMCSLVSGKLASDASMFDALAACFPTGTLTGTPKIEAMKLITQLEQQERGPWGGGVGYFSTSGEAMHAVNIRSVSASSGRLHMHSGSGIVYDSEPAREYAEIAAKKAAMDSAMQPFMEQS